MSIPRLARLSCWRIVGLIHRACSPAAVEEAFPRGEKNPVGEEAKDDDDGYPETLARPGGSLCDIHFIKFSRHSSVRPLKSQIRSR